MTNWTVGRGPPLHLGTSGSFTARASQASREAIKGSPASSTSVPSTWYSPSLPQRCLQGPPTNVVRAVSPLASGRLNRSTPTPTRSTTSPSPVAAYRGGVYATGSTPARSTSGQQSVSSSAVSVTVAPPGSMSAPPGPPILEGVISAGSARSVPQTWRIAPSSKLASGHAPSSASTSATSGTPEVKKGGELPLKPEQSSRLDSLASVHSGSMQVPHAHALQSQPKSAEQGQWSVNHSFRLGPRVDYGQAKVLDKTLANSVLSAVEQLNRGSLSCPEGICIVYATASRAYYCVHRPEMREVAHAKFKRSAEEGSKPDACYSGKGKGRTRGAIHVRRIHSMPLMGDSMQADWAPEEIDCVACDDVERPGRSANTVVEEETASTGSANVLAADSVGTLGTVALDSPVIVNKEVDSVAVGQPRRARAPEACSFPPRFPPRLAVASEAPREAPRARAVSPEQILRRGNGFVEASREAPRARAVSPDQIVKRNFCEKASPPPLHVRRSENSPTFTSLRSPMLSISGAGASWRPARQDSSHKERVPATLERASSAHGAGPPSHFSPRAQSRVLGSVSPQPRARPSLSRSLGMSSVASREDPGQTPRAGSLELPATSDFVAGSLSCPPAMSSTTTTSSSHQAAIDGDFECEVEISRRTFQLITVIGRGAFGIVWLARDKNDPGRKEIAVKAVTAKDSSGFITAAFEAELLQILTAAMPAASRAHVPQYVTHSSIRTAGGGGTVRLAMSFVPGGALDKWLYGISDEEHKTVDVTQLVDGHLPGGQQGSWLFTNACSIVRHLLSQLSAVFAALQPIAFHRDVSSHNVLVDFPEHEHALRPNFALIDFGLAVRSGSWMREWRNSNLAGDPRYWTPSAWMAFAFGFKYVATHPNSGFQQQYLQRMDHFSLGVLGLEALFALWNTGEAYEGKHPGLLEVRAAWCKYWVAVIHLFQMFHRQGAQEVRQFLAQSQDEGVTCMCNHLRQLRQSLRAAAAHPLNSKCVALLRVIADLIDERGTVTWTEIPLMLGEDSTDAAVTPSSPRGTATGTARSSIALQTDSQPSAVPRIEHRRIRSTGGTVDQELRRFEPEISTVLYQSLQTQQVPQWPSQSGASNNFSPDLLSRSFTHARPLSGYM